MVDLEFHNDLFSPGGPMELRQLRYFQAVARERSFTRAADRLHIAQPGISHQIRQLEAELGATLFDRTAKPVQLTPAGRALLPHAEGALDAADAGRDALDRLRGVVSGRVRLGTIPGIPHIDLAGLLAAFHAQHPHVEMTLREEHPVPLLEHLRHDDYDAAIVGLSQPEPPDGLNGQAISAEQLVLVVAPDHRLGHLRWAPVTQLRDEPLVTLTRGSALRTHVENACDAAGFPARVALETSDINLLGELVARGLGVTVVPRAMAEAAAARHPLRIVGIRPAITQRHTVLVWNEDRPHSTAVEAFLTHARAWAASGAP
jgi:DNA-binding transcriptional LysR family regulator